MTDVRPDNALEVIHRHLPPGRMDLVLDMDKSHGATLVDARDGTEYLDLFSFFASNALGMNHPRFTSEVVERLGRLAVNKPSNSDIPTVEMAQFTAVFDEVLGVEGLPYRFFIEGGALGVENALKAAFDWKSRHNEAHGRDPGLGTQVMHLTRAFHGRTGYTLSLTNTEPVKTDRFTQFSWPRINVPALKFPLDDHADRNDDADERALAQAAEAFVRHKHDIACFIAEPIQSEGGDNHLSAGFLQGMQDLCRKHDALFVIDEVQTGVGMSGTAWCFQQLGIEPDLVAFGKKTHVCGVLGGGRIDEVDDHVWKVAGRLNSTFGGNFLDMVRATTILEVIRDENLIERAATVGAGLLRDLESLGSRHDRVTNVRGRGLLCAFDLPDDTTRDAVISRAREEHRVLLLGCGERSIRLRPALTIGEDELARGLEALDAVLSSSDAP
ncbi:MAG: L-lysine 6-transaminase [Nitriliruptorales bacterium]|nr:L-lysine 6-transaminase [Nitriliruptorales bacterium]